MTDLAATAHTPIPRLDTSSEAATRRIQKRYRAEARFKAYGIIALGITAAFLILLILDIIRNGTPAFTQHVLTVPVTVPADLVPADKRGDERAIRSADFFPLARNALDTAIPGIESRSGQRTLSRLLSTGAMDDLRNRLVTEPELFGQTVKVPLLLSADADLYFKSPASPIARRPGRGTAIPSGTTGEITIQTSANDFAETMAALKIAVRGKIQQREAEIRRLSFFGSDTVAQRIREMTNEISALKARLDAPVAEEALDRTLPSQLVEINGGLVKLTKLSASSVTGDVLLPLGSAAEAKAGDWKIMTLAIPEGDRKVNDQQIAFLERFRDSGLVESRFNAMFFQSGDSREPELAGIRGAIVGSALTLLVTLALCLPIGVLAAIYLEEFAPKNRLTDLVEVNINNLAAVPSIVFGLLGLAVFLAWFGLPRSAPLVGGLVLALMSLPTVIIATRAAIKAVPPSIKEAALGVGASHQQAVFHHVLPLAMPGIMTGTIIAMAQALGETAPLLMIGMVAFIVDVPTTPVDAATVLPVQIYLWSDLPELAFRYKTAGAIMVLLGFLFVMNGAAIYLRRKFERRW
jgi:phosphate transport system permease protein